MFTGLGGEGGIRTLAQVAPPKALAKPPLRPLGYFSVSVFLLPCLMIITHFISVFYLN